MSGRIDLRDAVATALKAFAARPLAEASEKLFSTLGYSSDRRISIATSQEFLGQLDPHGRLGAQDRATLGRTRSLELLFQLTDAEIVVDRDMFDDRSAMVPTQINSYLFFAIDLPAGQYTRTALASLVRAVNKPLPMPAIVLFRHEGTISIGIIQRRISKRDQTKDVLAKVTLIKDVAAADPIRAHLEILNDFALANLDADFGASTFVRLHEAWQKRLGSYALSNDFYREIADWYFWAHHQVDNGTIRLPQHCNTQEEQSLFLIRLLTRVIFSWFLVEKRLIPAELFRTRDLRALLTDFQVSQDPKAPDVSPTFYRAILQNLFFGTLNMPSEQRSFRIRKKAGERYDENYGVTSLWRYETAFRDTKAWLQIAARIPFLNGGLFECLDDKSGKKQNNFILDGFSDREDFGCHLPNDLFFGPERNVDLSSDYGEEGKRAARSRKAKVRGLIEILSRYKFTIEENTPLEEEIALDPELLGKVFENLLASYNEDTRTTARKALGAFYTPREIVSYMVDEALKSYLSTQVPRCKGALDDLFSNKATLKEIKPDTREALIAAIGRVKILDPACGSGAFPMGALHRLVDLLQKLDPNNESWKRDRLAEARSYRQLLESSAAPREEIAACDLRIREIEKSFDTRFHALDFARKIYIIENCIYGVDIQPIATQIAKLRFFISLIVDQKVDPNAANLGVRPLPNLETRLVAANTLIPIDTVESDLFSTGVDKLRAELSAIRHEHFNARSPSAKRKWRNADATKRIEIAALLEGEHAIPRDSARLLAAWDPYDQNSFAPFFDSEWMFGLTANRALPSDESMAPSRTDRPVIGEAGLQATTLPNTLSGRGGSFDVVIGNPPYVRQEQLKHLKKAFKRHYECYTGTADLFVFFYEAGVRLLRDGGTLSFITSNKWLRSGYGQKLRAWLARNTSVLQIIDFGDAPVFTAIAYPSILIVQRTSTPADSAATVRVLTWVPDSAIDTFADVFARKSFTLPQTELKADGWRLELGSSLRLLERMRLAGRPLGEYVNNRFFYGIKTGLNEAFVVDGATRDSLIAEHKSSADVLKPFLRGRDIKRWRVDSPDLWLLFVPWHFPLHQDPSVTGASPEAESAFKKQYPAIHRHLSLFKAQLIARNTAETGIRYEWYALQRWGAEYWREFGHAKVVYPDIYEHQSFTWDETGLYPGNTCYFIPTTEKWFTGLLNSTSVEWFYSHVSNRVRGGYFRAFSDYMKTIPIPPATSAQQVAIERLVDSLLFLNRRFADTPDDHVPRDRLMIAFWEMVLNGLVYELYFPLEVHGAGLQLFALFAQVQLPDERSMSESDRLSILRELFEAHYDGSHPLRIALEKLQSLDMVRIIEGKV